MKKLIAILLTLCMTLSLLVACGSNGSVGDTGNTEPSSGSVGNAGTNDNNDELIVVVLPASLFTEDEEFDVDAYVEENGYTSAAFNEDGSLTVKMTKARHQEQLSEIEQSLKDEFSKLVSGENTPYIKEITNNDDYSTVTMKVDRESYEDAFDLTPFTIGMSVYFYHMILGREYRCQIDIVDVATGDVIDTVTYPDALNS